MEPNIFQFIGESVTNATAIFTAPAAARLILALKGIVVVCVTIYLMITGYMIMVGAVATPVWSFFVLSARILIVSAFALQIDLYTNTVLEFFTSLEVGLATAMSSTGATPTSVYQSLDQTLGQALSIVTRCFQMAITWNPGEAIAWVVTGMLVLLGSGGLLVLGAVVLIIAKFAIAVLFALGPLFIFALLFPVTAKFFEAWFAQVMNYLLVGVIVGIVLAFAMAAFSRFVVGADFSGDGEVNPIRAAAEITALTGILGLLIWNARTLAQGLAGGMSLVGVTIRQLANVTDPVSTRRDLETGHMVTARRSNHLIAGNTAINPAYRQHVMQNMFKNYGKAKGGKVKR